MDLRSASVSLHSIYKAETIFYLIPRTFLKINVDLGFFGTVENTLIFARDSAILIEEWVPHGVEKGCICVYTCTH